MNLSTCTTLETIAAMLQQESQGYRTIDFLSHSVAQQCPLPLEIDADCRSKMAAWCYQVVDFCNFNRETVAISMNYLDRFVAVDCSLLYSRTDYQLAAMTCVYTAIKLNEPEAIDPQTVSDLSKGAYTAAQVEAMERRLVTALNWRMNPPTAMSFVRSYLDLMDNTSATALPEVYRAAIYDIAKFQTELAVTEYDFLLVPPSIVAYCAVLNALDAMPHVFGEKMRTNMAFLLARSIQLDVTTPKNDLVQRVQGCLFAAVVQSDAMTASANVVVPNVDTTKPSKGGASHAVLQSSPRVSTICA